MSKDKKEEENIITFNTASTTLGIVSTYIMSNDSNIINYTIDDDVYLTQPVITHTTNVTALTADSGLLFSTDNINFTDPYEKLEKYESEEEEDVRLRKEYPVLQEAYDEYLLIKKLVEDTPFDKTFEHRYAGFIKK